MSVVIPTLAADSALLDCVRSLQAQTYGNFEVIVVDNSGKGAARALGLPDSPAALRIIENDRNAGFGTAINQGWRASGGCYVATLNDDAAAEPGWLSAMVEAAESDSEIGLIACQVRLSETALDSAGMLIAGDGSSKQRGHGRNPANYAAEEEVLMPSGSAALYRRALLDDIGGFADDFFLYCEDSDLGLRARRRGWGCRYVPSAIVRHAYSGSAGRASALKALLVERNRLYLLVRNFPLRMLLGAPAVALVRYFWHLVYMWKGTGKAAEFAQSGGSGASLPLVVLRAHWQALMHLPVLLTERRRIRAHAYLNDRQFGRLLAAHSISSREVAAL